MSEEIFSFVIAYIENLTNYPRVFLLRCSMHVLYEMLCSMWTQHGLAGNAMSVSESLASI